MLPGVARKLAIPCALLSIVGWLLYAAGFLVRNFAYKDSVLTNLEHAAQPEFFSFWLFLITPPLMYTFTVLYTFWKHRLPRFFLHMFLPLFLIGVGGVLMVDGVAIYDYLIDDSSKKVLICRDALTGTGTGRFSTVEDIHGDAKYIPIEFGGAAAALLFYYLYLLLVPCFATSKKEYD